MASSSRLITENDKHLYDDHKIHFDVYLRPTLSDRLDLSKSSRVLGHGVREDLKRKVFDAVSAVLNSDPHLQKLYNALPEPIAIQTTYVGFEREKPQSSPQSAQDDELLTNITSSVRIDARFPLKEKTLKNIAAIANAEIRSSGYKLVASKIREGDRPRDLGVANRQDNQHLVDYIDDSVLLLISEQVFHAKRAQATGDLLTMIEDHKGVLEPHQIIAKTMKLLQANNISTCHSFRECFEDLYADNTPEEFVEIVTKECEYHMTKEVFVNLDNDRMVQYDPSPIVEGSEPSLELTQRRTM
jgi:hypothetical protein